MIPLPPGILLIVVTFVDFFLAFGSTRPPKRFWCGFGGVPWVVVGASCLQTGYLRKITDYAAGETLPVAVDKLKPLLRRPTHPVERRKALEQPRADVLITEAEHTQKRAGILRGL